jgi:endogenous inhibitor of DNA gyrase (YacG/DUF329 family)
MRKCRTCGRDGVAKTDKHFPFCSERCQLVDLGKWLNEEYRIPGEPASPDDLPQDDREEKS